MRLATSRVFLVYLILAFVWLLPASLSPLSGFVSVPYSDASQVLWAMVNYEPFGNTFGQLAYPPRGVDFGYIHWVTVPLLVSKPFIALLGPVGAYNLLLWLSVALCGFGAHLLAQEEELSPQGAWFCGIGFGLCPALTGQMMLGHFFNVFGAFLVPFYLLVFLRFFKSKNQRLYGPLILILWISLLRTSNYYALFLIPVSVILAVLYVFIKKKASVQSAVLLLLAGVLCSVLALAQSSPNSDTALFLPRWDVEFYDADLLGIVTPSPYHSLWGKEFERSGDRVTFCGFTILLLGLWACRERKRPIFGILFLFMTCMTWGPVAYWNGEAVFRFPWAALFELPGYSGVQVFARAGVIAQLFLVLWAAPVIRKNSHLALILGLVLVEFCIAPQARQDVKGSQILTELRQKPPGSVAFIPYEAANTTPLYYQLLHHKTLVRSAVLRPSRQLHEFFLHLPWLTQLQRADGYIDLPLEQAGGVQQLVDLRYIILQKDRLGPTHTTRWEQALGQCFTITARLENDSLLVLSLEPSSESFESAELEFAPSDLNYCSWGLGEEMTRDHRSTRSIYGKQGQIWLPLSDDAPRVLEIRALSPLSKGALVFWNGNLLGPFVSADRWTVAQFQIPQGASQPGANELRIEIQGVLDDQVRSFDLDYLRIKSVSEN